MLVHSTAVWPLHGQSSVLSGTQTTAEWHAQTTSSPPRPPPPDPDTQTQPVHSTVRDHASPRRSRACNWCSPPPTHPNPCRDRMLPPCDALWTCLHRTPTATPSPKPKPRDRLVTQTSSSSSKTPTHVCMGPHMLLEVNDGRMAPSPAQSSNVRETMQTAGASAGCCFASGLSPLLECVRHKLTDHLIEG